MGAAAYRIKSHHHQKGMTVSIKFSIRRMLNFIGIVLIALKDAVDRAQAHRWRYGAYRSHIFSSSPTNDMAAALVLLFFQAMAIHRWHPRARYS
jgi:hypothetical protein